MDLSTDACRSSDGARWRNQKSPELNRAQLNFLPMLPCHQIAVEIRKQRLIGKNGKVRLLETDLGHTIRLTLAKPLNVKDKIRAFKNCYFFRNEWWAMRDSNSRHPRCKRDALPTELIALPKHFAFSRNAVLSQGLGACKRFIKGILLVSQGAPLMVPKAGAIRERLDALFIEIVFQCLEDQLPAGLLF